MSISQIVIMGFIILESTNILALYFAPDTRYANSVGVFNAWEKSKQDPEMHHFVQYLVNWVAGTKLIFIMLLIVILSVADERLLTYTSLALVISISSFFWRLFPLIHKMDQENEISPKRYSTALGWMIGAFILIFIGTMIIG